MNLTNINAMENHFICQTFLFDLTDWTVVFLLVLFALQKYLVRKKQLVSPGLLSQPLLFSMMKEEAVYEIKFHLSFPKNI